MAVEIIDPGVYRAIAGGLKGIEGHRWRRTKDRVATDHATCRAAGHKPRQDQWPSVDPIVFSLERIAHFSFCSASMIASPSARPLP